jgi:CBS domain-containing protein
MTLHPVVVAPDLGCDEADALMRALKVRHLLVGADERLCGVLCRCDLCSGRASVERVADRMSREVFTLDPEATLGEAASAFAQLHVGILPVVAGERVVGVLTRGDLRRIGVPDALLGTRSCVICGSYHGVRPEPQCGLECCLECIDVIEALIDATNFGEGD